MIESEPPGGCMLVFSFLIVGALIGFFAGVVVDRSYMTKIQWDELVKRGYAEQIESSQGTVYRWKEVR